MEGKVLCENEVSHQSHYTSDFFASVPADRIIIVVDLFSLEGVTPSEKSSINTNTKSTMRFPMSQR